MKIIYCANRIIVSPLFIVMYAGVQVVLHTSSEIKCLTGEPPRDSPVVADENGSYSIVENGYRFRGK